VDEEEGKGYPSSRVFVGPLRGMKELPVKSVLRYRDGRTTILEIVGSKKKFEFPAKLRVGVPATHGSDVLVQRSKGVDLPVMKLLIE
jgi:hypothetical protein